METEARFCLQNLINVAYQLAMVENAPKTEAYIAKLISFFRYYFNGNGRAVLLREELHQLGAFFELFTESTLRGVSLEFPPDLIENSIYISSNNIITKIMGILFDVARPIYSNYKVTVLSGSLPGKDQTVSVAEKIQINTAIQNEDILDITIGIVKGDWSGWK